MTSSALQLENIPWWPGWGKNILKRWGQKYTTRVAQKVMHTIATLLLL